MIVLLLLVTCLNAVEPLQIHVFNVGQADSQLIVFPSGYSVLIDAGEISTSNTMAKRIAPKIQDILGSRKVNVAVATHLHQDHIGGPKGGFRYLVEEEGFVFDKLIDRNVGTWNDDAGTGVCDKDTIKWKYAGTYSSTAVNWICYVTPTKASLQTKLSKIRVIAELCSKDQIKPLDAGAEVQIVVTDARGVKMQNGADIAANHVDEAIPPSENDYSIGLRIKYGDFVYNTNGDLDGRFATSSYGYYYHNVESVYKDIVGEVDLFHLNHHGSENSNNAEFLDVLKPTAAIVSCGTDNTYGHPTDLGIKNVVKTAQEIFMTNDCNSAVTSNYGEVTNVDGDVLVEYTYGDSVFYVSDAKKIRHKKFNVKFNKKKPATCKIPS